MNDKIIFLRHSKDKNKDYYVLLVTEVIGGYVLKLNTFISKEQAETLNKEHNIQIKDLRK